MAVSKTGKTGSKGKKKNTTKAKQSVSSGFQTEIILLVILAASIILLASNFGWGGFVGAAISDVCFGLMGLITYVFPVALFIGAAFLMSNHSNPLAYKKTAAALVFFIFLCGFIQLLIEGYNTSTTLMDYYTLCSDYHTGGGLIGGAICISTTSAFGIVGGYAIIILVLIVCLILITQRSFFGFLNHIQNGIFGMIKGIHENYREGQPEREQKKELRALKKQHAREERLRLLEEEMAEEEAGFSAKKASAGSKKKSESANSKSVSSSRRKRTSGEEEQETRVPFLEGTKLTPPREPEILPETSVVQPEEEPDDEKDLTVSSQPSGQGQMEFRIHRSETSSEPDIQEIEEIEDTEEPDKEEPTGQENRDVQEEQMMPADQERPDFLSDLEEKKEASLSEEAMAPVPPSGEEKPSRQPSGNPRSSAAEVESGIINIRHEISQQEQPVKKVYQYPPLKLLKRGDGNKKGDSDEYLRKTAKKLQDTLHNFGVNVTVSNVSCGPTVTRYELQPEMGVKVSKIVGLADDIKLNLATPEIRIEAPIPGKAAVGIEVPNKENSAVMLRDLLQSEEFRTAKSRLSFAVGKDIAGKTVVTDIAKMPHLLIAGATGSGKSVCINTLIMSILYKASPDDVKLIMIDPKVVELSVYNGIPHLFIPVVTDPKKAAGALNWAVSEMTSRYNTFAEFTVRNLDEYNRKVENMTIPEGETRPEKMPQIVIIVDELADLMMAAPGEVEDAICRLAQLARAAGIHLIIATQRPSVNVITGLIKANMPSRIAFSVSSGVDSRTILDMNGAEKLLGKGDMLFYPQGLQKPARLQGAFVSDEEVSRVVEFLTDKNPKTEYNSQIEQHVNTINLMAGASGAEERDIYFADAGKYIIEKERASIGMLQRVMKIGFNRAARIMDQLCDAGVVGPEEGTKPRKILMTMEEFQTYLEEHV